MNEAGQTQGKKMMVVMLAGNVNAPAFGEDFRRTFESALKQRERFIRFKAYRREMSDLDKTKSFSCNAAGR
jgi:hypothetical protein